jgi:hypothetical protein
MRKAFDELTAADVMQGGVVAIPATLSLRGAARVLAEAGACAAPVTDSQGRCVGLLRAADIPHRVADQGVPNPEPVGFWSEWQMDAPAGETDGRMPPAPQAALPDASEGEGTRLLRSTQIAGAVLGRRHRPASVLSRATVAADPPPDANGRQTQAGPTPGRPWGSDRGMRS